MKDAELMTTAPDVPIVEIVPITWYVFKDGLCKGMVSMLGYGPDARFQCILFTGTAASPDFTDRNAAVQWILDQHKGVQS